MNRFGLQTYDTFRLLKMMENRRYTYKTILANCFSEWRNVPQEIIKNVAGFLLVRLRRAILSKPVIIDVEHSISPHKVRLVMQNVSVFQNSDTCTGFLLQKALC